MAQNTTPKKTNTSSQKKPATQTRSTQARTTASRNTNQKVVRNNSNVPHPSDKAPVPVKQQPPKNNTGKGGNTNIQKGKAPQNKKTVKKESKAAQLVPYILIVVAVLFVMCFVTNAFCNPANYLDGSEGDHALGYVGYYVCEIVLGIFGPAAYAIPLVLLNLALFWKNYMENEKIGVKITLTVSTLITISALLHIILNVDDVDMLTNFGELYEMGAARQGGGILGGYIALGLVKIGKVPLAIFILIAVLIPLVLFLVGTHPQAMIDKISAWVKAQKEAAAADRARREDDKRYEQLQAEKEDLKRQKKLEAQKKKFDEQRAQYYAQKEANEEEISDYAENDSDDDVVINNAAFEESDEQYADESQSYELDYSNLNSEPDMSDSFRESSDTNDEIVLNLENIGDYDEFEEEENIEDNSVKFVINNPDDEPPMEEYGADEDDFGGDLDATLAEGYVVDQVTGEIIGERPAQMKPYKFPPFDLLKSGPASYAANQDEISKNTRILRDTLESFKVKINEVSCSCGPTVTRYEIKPAPGVKVKQIANLGDDIAMGLAKSGVRIEAPIPGKAAVGVEVPNDDRSTVFLRNIIEAPEFQNHKSKTAACLGADISGRPIVFDIEKMPHLLVAGTTGSGKSICINSIIMSILYKAKPSEVKLVLIDPKKVEFNVYKDIPHLSCRIVSDPKKAAGALNSAVNEMEKRFKLIEQVGVRNITGYNEITKDDPDMPYMPRMVIIIDELADLMMTAKEDVETAICRIAQKARAAGIHLILGTQRPSVDVITGLIKANVPSRIAFTVRSMVDSRTVIDISGAEKLLGMGDMLYMPVGAPKPIRVQGAFVGDAEVEKIVDYIKDNNDPVVYDSDFEKSIDEEAAKCGNPKRSTSDDMDRDSDGGSDSEDPKFWEAIELAIDAGKISTSLLQRRLEIGYGRAAKIIDRLEERGFVGPADGNKPRKILVTHQDIAEKRMNG